MKKWQSDVSEMLGGCGGCGGCFLAIIVVNLLIGSSAAKYCLIHWLPAIHASYPAIGLLNPATSIWSIKLMMLGLIGGEVLIPVAFVRWVLRGLVVGQYV